MADSKLIKKFLTLGAGLLAAFLVLEILLRVFDPIPYHVKGDRIVLPVNQKSIQRNGDSPFLSPVVTRTKNAIGFRGENPPVGFGEYLTIVTVGGSTTEEMDKSDDETWTWLIGEKLKQNFNRVWVNNGGLDGTSTFGNLLLMEDYIAKLHPKVVLFLIGANDVEKDPDKFDLRLLKQRPNSFKAWLKKSEVIAYALNFRRAYVARKRNLPNQPWFFRSDQIKYREMSPEEQEQVFKKYTDYLDTQYVPRVEKLIEVSLSHGIEPILVTQPTPLGVVDPVTGLNLATFELEKLSMNGSLYWRVLQAYNEATKSTGRKHDAMVIDLGALMPKSTEYFYDMMHFTLAGSRKVSEIIYEELAAHLSQTYPEFIK